LTEIIIIIMEMYLIRFEVAIISSLLR
jgi:hypothetical protein